MDEVRAEVALDMILEPGANSEEFEVTYKNWKDQLRRLAYVYDYVLNKKRIELNRINISVLILTSLTTLVLASQFGIDACKMESLIISLQVIVTASSFVSSILGGIMTIYGLADNVSTLQRYLDTVENFYSSIATNDGLPTSLQISNQDFVSSNRDRYDHIVRHAPNIGTNAYVEAMKDFELAKVRFKDTLHPQPNLVNCQ